LKRKKIYLAAENGTRAHKLCKITLVHLAPVIQGCFKMGPLFVYLIAEPSLFVEDKIGSIEFRMGDVARGKRLGASLWS
jgi:hypothetical protein